MVVGRGGGWKWRRGEALPWEWGEAGSREDESSNFAAKCRGFGRDLVWFV